MVSAKIIRVWMLALAIALHSMALAGPPEDIAPGLVLTSLRGLADANLSADFSEFHATLAPNFKEHTDSEKLLELFGWLADPAWGLDWTAMDKAEPAIKTVEPIGGSGRIRINGAVALGAIPLQFEMEFVEFRGEWLLDSIIARPAYDDGKSPP